MKKKPEKTEWEDVIDNQYNYTERMWVPGGWLVRTYKQMSGNPSLAMTYLPDANHDWEIVT